jgi:hypothetical protein
MERRGKIKRILASVRWRLDRQGIGVDLLNLNTPPQDLLREALHEELADTTEGNSPRPASVAERLCQALCDPDRERRQGALAAVQARNTSETVAALIGALHDPDPEMRLVAAAALGRLASPQGVEPLLALLHDPHARVRGRAIQALGEIGEPRAIRPLLEVLPGRNRPVTLRALEQIVKRTWRAGNPRQVPLLLPLTRWWWRVPWRLRRQARAVLSYLRTVVTGAELSLVAPPPPRPMLTGAELSPVAPAPSRFRRSGRELSPVVTLE